MFCGGAWGQCACTKTVPKNVKNGRGPGLRTGRGVGEGQRSHRESMGNHSMGVQCAGSPQAPNGTNFRGSPVGGWWRWWGRWWGRVIGGLIVRSLGYVGRGGGGTKPTADLGLGLALGFWRWRWRGERARACVVCTYPKTNPTGQIQHGCASLTPRGTNDGACGFRQTWTNWVGSKKPQKPAGAAMGPRSVWAVADGQVRGPADGRPGGGGKLLSLISTFF